MLTADMASALMTNSVYLLNGGEQALIQSLAAVMGWTALMVLAMALLAIGNPDPPAPGI